MENSVVVTGDTLKITRIFDVPRDVLFGVFSDPEKIQEWSGCAGAVCLGGKVDFRVGGRYENTIEIPPSTRLTMFGTYTDIVVPERIGYTLEWDKPFPVSSVLIEFFDRGTQTELRLTHSGLATPEMRENVPGGWEASLGRLAQGLKETPTA